MNYRLDPPEIFASFIVVYNDPTTLFTVLQ